MIEIVSMKTLSARDPDQRARTKPIEITSMRPPPSTSSSVGVMTLSTVSGVSACEARSMTRSLSTSTLATSKRSAMNPIVPARPNTSGGSERIAKNAASPARPVTR